MKLQDIISGGKQWLSRTPERSLDAAYRAALKIKAIEDEHFQGQKVAKKSGNYSDSASAFFLSDVQNYLKTIKVRLAEFQISRSLLIFSQTPPNENQLEIVYTGNGEYSRELSIVEKLNLIDQVTSKYKEERVSNNSFASLEVNGQVKQVNGQVLPSQKNNFADKKVSINKKNQLFLSGNGSEMNEESLSDKTSVLPRSFMRTLNRIRQEIDPQAENTEEEVIKKFRKSRNKTAISIRFLLLLIIVPLFTHQFTKTFLIAPVVERYFNNHEQILFINKDLQEEAFSELHEYEENLHFQGIIGLAPALSEEEIKTKLQEKAGEIAEEYRHHGIDSVSNIFADICSFFAFATVIFFCKREIQIVKSFMDEIVYGLSDSAKAFLIILLTDMFVGYHSPHGWEVILEAISRHLGLPENRDFNFLFIATFPVILDTILKYWIFRYLNRISPSSVATYKNMNE
jgi:hypothetical protein